MQEGCGSKGVIYIYINHSSVILGLTSSTGHYRGPFPQGNEASRVPNGVRCKSSWRQNTLSYCQLKDNLLENRAKEQSLCEVFILCAKLQVSKYTILSCNKSRSRVTSHFDLCCSPNFTNHNTCCKAVQAPASSASTAPPYMKS